MNGLPAYARPVRFGVLTGFAPGPGPAEEAEAYGARAAREARLVEAHGFDSVWLPEHVVVPVTHASRYPYAEDGRMPIPVEADLPDPLVWLAYVAAATTSLRLATGCLVLPHRNPLVLAK